jgi:hypothetical protein
MEESFAAKILIIYYYCSEYKILVIDLLIS